MPRRVYCTCHGVEHPLLASQSGAIICENCGNIPCAAQGEGDCLFCGAPFDKATGRISLQPRQIVTQKASGEPEKDAPIGARNPGYERVARETAAKNSGSEQKHSHPSDPEAEKKAAEEFRRLILRNVEEYVGTDPDQAVLDDQMDYVPFDD